MTQLQIIQKEIEELKDGPAIIQFWKEETAKGNLINIAYGLKIELKTNREWLTRVTSEDFVQLIEQFNPITEAEIELGELINMVNRPKDSRNFSAIRKKISDIETLYKMSEL